MKIEQILIFIFLVIVVFLLYNKNKEHLLVGNEAVIDISKIYRDSSGTATFNNLNTNYLNTNNLNSKYLDISGNTNIKGALDISGNTNIKGALDISGNTSIKGTLDISGNTNIKGNVNVSQELLFKTNERTNDYQGIHTFWMQSGWNEQQEALIKNPDGETYSADNWVCVVLYSYRYSTVKYDQNRNGIDGIYTYVDTDTNNWCIHKWIYIGERALYVPIICYPKKMFSKVWANKSKFTVKDQLLPSGSDWNTKI